MSIFDKIRERSSIISFIVKMQNTALYPVLFAIICVISGTNGKDVYLPCIYILTALSIFAGLFSADMKVFLVPAFMVYYAIGADVAEDYYAGYNFLPPFDISSLGPFMICLVLLSATLIYKLIASRHSRKSFKREDFSSGASCLWILPCF